MGDFIHDYIIGFFGAFSAAVVWLVGNVIGNRQDISIIKRDHCEATRRLDEIKRDLSDGFGHVNRRLDKLYKTGED